MSADSLEVEGASSLSAEPPTSTPGLQSVGPTAALPGMSAILSQQVPVNYLGAWKKHFRLNYIAKSIQGAKDQGLTVVQAGATWYCPIWEKEVPEANLESHMDTNRHLRYKGL